MEYVIILSGDQLYQMDFRHMLNFHIENGAEITVGAFPVSGELAPGMGIMCLGPKGQVKNFKEKPRVEELQQLGSSGPRCGATQDESRPFLASMGIYVFRKRFLIDLLTESKAVDFGKEVFPESIHKHKVFAYVFDGYWTDIGTIRSFYEANLGLTGSLPHFNFYSPQVQVYTRPRNLPASKLNNCNVHQSIIAEGCILNGADIRHSVIGVRSRIGGGSTIKNSVIMGADYYETTQDLADNSARGAPNIGIGNHCTIINAIVDKNARIGDNVSIINAHNLQEKDGEDYYIRDGVFVVPKGALIPNGTVI